jgi:DUF971 family protein
VPAVSNVPTEIRVHRRSREIALTYADGRSVRIPCELLRVFSPSAEVRGHGSEDRKLVTGKKYVNVESIERIGNYAIRIVFDDGHDTGIYSWDYLAELAAEQTQYWQRYLDDLKIANSSRLPTIAVGQWRSAPEREP